MRRAGGRIRRDGFPAMLLFLGIPFGALLLAAGGHPAGMIDSDEEIRSRTESWRVPATEAAREAGVPLDLLLALVATESSGRPGATSSSGACGLTQLMPATARGTAARMPGLDPESLDLHEPVLNLRIGAAVLAEELRSFSGDAALALAAYHRGAREPDRWRRDLPGRPGIEVVRARAPDRTRGYVERVLARRKWFAAKPSSAPQSTPLR